MNKIDESKRMTRREAIKMLERIKYRINYEVTDAQKKMDALNMAIKSLEQEPCEDCISRQAAIAAADYADYTGLAIEDAKRVTDEIVKGLKQLPPVTPAEKVGRWIVHPKGIYAHLVCSNCLSSAPYDCETNYCPNCGEKKEVDNEEA